MDRTACNRLASMKLPPEVDHLVGTIISCAIALAARVGGPELEQGFEFPWGHSDSLEMPPKGELFLTP